MEDPREQWLSSLSLDRSRVKLVPAKILLLGGPLDKSPIRVRKLLRDFIWASNSSIKNGLIIAEDFPDWIHDSVYSDLLTFESDIAQIVTLIVIVLESAGSIAELGAFSVNDCLKDKVVVVMRSHHYKQDSFIKYGLLRQLKDKNVLSYPYVKSNPEAGLSNYYQDILDHIVNYVEDIDRTEKFDKTNRGHIAFLIRDVVALHHALIEKEIISILRKLDLPSNRKEVRSMLFLLEKLKLVSKERLGGVDYYYVLDEDHRMVFRFEGKTMERTKTSLGIMEYYDKNDTEKKRANAIQYLMGQK